MAHDENESKSSSVGRIDVKSKVVASGSLGIRNEYASLGVDNYYNTHGKNYRNPHEMKINEALKKVLFNNKNKWMKELDLSYVLDLCCGSGEMTMFLKNYLTRHQQQQNMKIDAIDPYTNDAYLKRTGMTAYKHNFEDIHNGILWEIMDSKYKCYSLVVCCYALHLCENSRLSSVCYCLSMVANKLLIITPHKRPVIDRKMGWDLLYENVDQKVRIRLYQSMYHQ